jgi:hypothetical protein
MEKEAKANANLELTQNLEEAMTEPKAEPKAEDYAPYHLFPAFQEGFKAYRHHSTCIYDADSVECQAFDRGMEYAYRLHCYAFRRT